jgi:hypothetical protein
MNLVCELDAKKGLSLLTACRARRKSAGRTEDHSKVANKSAILTIPGALL